MILKGAQLLFSEGSLALMRVLELSDLFLELVDLETILISLFDLLFLKGLLVRLKLHLSRLTLLITVIDSETIKDLGHGYLIFRIRLPLSALLPLHVPHEGTLLTICSKCSLVIVLLTELILRVLTEITSIFFAFSRYFLVLNLLRVNSAWQDIIDTLAYLIVDIVLAFT